MILLLHNFQLRKSSILDYFAPGIQFSYSVILIEVFLLIYGAKLPGQVGLKFSFSLFFNIMLNLRGLLLISQFLSQVPIPPVIIQFLLLAFQPILQFHYANLEFYYQLNLHLRFNLKVTLHLNPNLNHLL